MTNGRARSTRYLVRATAIVVYCFAFASSGCSDANYTDPGKTVTNTPDNEQVFAKVMKRPPIEQIVASYQGLQTKIRERLVAEVGLSEFQERLGSGSRGGGCGSAFPGVDSSMADEQSLNRWTSPGNLPDGKWPQALRVVSETARDYGFTERTLLKDQPGQHDVSLHDQYGGELTFGTAENTVLRIYTSCHPYADNTVGPPSSPR